MSRSKLVSNIIVICNKAFGKYLLATNVLSSGFLMGFGDAVEQVIELNYKMHPTGTFDWNRITNMALVGFLIGAPQHYFYAYMDFRMPGNNKSTVFKKILLDQTIASPTCLIIFFYGLGLIEYTFEDDKPLTCGHEEFKKKFTTVYMMDWMFWPPVQFINFFFLAPKYRVIYVNGMTMIYDVLLSYIKFIYDPKKQDKSLH